MTKYSYPTQNRPQRRTKTYPVGNESRENCMACPLLTAPFAKPKGSHEPVGLRDPESDDNDEFEQPLIFSGCGAPISRSVTQTKKQGSESQ